MQETQGVAAVLRDMPCLFSGTMYCLVQDEGRVI